MMDVLCSMPAPTSLFVIRSSKFALPKKYRMMNIE